MEKYTSCSRVSDCYSCVERSINSTPGSRDPYVVTGYGAGFVMCWRENVKWRVCQDEDPRKFMSVESGEYILAVPDYTHQARQGMETAGRDSDTLSITSSTKGGALFKKVIMKLTGNVQWLAGLMFERKTDIGGRSYDFVPHYDVVLKTPFFARAPKGEVLKSVPARKPTTNLWIGIRCL